MGKVRWSPSKQETKLGKVRKAKNENSLSRLVQKNRNFVKPQNACSTPCPLWALWSGQVHHCGQDHQRISQRFRLLRLPHYSSTPRGRGRRRQLPLCRHRKHAKVHRQR